MIVQAIHPQDDDDDDDDQEEALENEFSDEICREAASPRATRRWSLTLASLQSAFVEQTTRGTINGDLNEEIAAGIVTCFPGDIFDATGIWVTSGWTDDTGTYVSSAGLPSGAPTTPAPGASRTTTSSSTPGSPAR